MFILELQSSLDESGSGVYQGYDLSFTLDPEAAQTFHSKEMASVFGSLSPAVNQYSWGVVDRS